jgi:multiple sugar transport system substrate-binding protein
MENKKLSRREFLKAAAASATGVAMFTQMGPIVTVFASPAQQDAVTLTFAVHWELAFQPTQEAWDTKYTTEHPNIKIEKIYNTWADHNAIVLTWAAAGQLPDFLYVHGSRAYPWAKQNILMPLDKYIADDKDFDIEGVFQEALRLYKVDDKQYAIPYDHGPILLGYNKDAFDAAKMDYPKEDWTIEDFADAAKKLSEPGQKWGGGPDIGLGNESYPATLGIFGGATFSDDETKLLLDTDGSRQGLNFWNDLMHKDHALSEAAEMSSFSGDARLSGQYAMFRIATWDIPTFHDLAAFKYDVAPWPTGPAGRHTGSFGSGFAGTATTKHPDEVWQYLSEYLSKDGMEFMWAKSGRGSPARDAAYQAFLDAPIVPEHTKYFQDAMKDYAVTGHPYQSTTGPQVYDVISQNLTLLQTGEIDVDTFIKNCMDQSAPIFAQKT